jgi:cell wall-associated NlpC family hydrolase
MRPPAHPAARRPAPAVARTPAPCQSIRPRAPWLLIALAAVALPARAMPEWGPPAVESAPVTRPAAAGERPGAGDAILQLLHERGLLSGVEPAGSGPPARAGHDAASELVISAMNFLDVRYRRGGNSAAEGFDCSGFTRHVFESALGLVLPRRAEQQASLAGLLEVPREGLRPGDLVFFDTMRRAFSHVGIYVGEGRFIHAPRSGARVRIEDMREGYWTRRYNGARRAERPAASIEVAEPAGSPQR